MKLGTLLLRNAAIGLSQLEAALRNQVLYGGRLGTNLVELGFIDLELLSSYLSELAGLPVATQTLLEACDRGLLDRLGSDDAHRLRAIPLAYLAEDRRTIGVAMVDPDDGRALEALGGKLGATIAPHVVPELRALYYLEKHFGAPRRARFVRTARPGSEPEPTEERRRSQPAGGLALPPTFTLEPRRRRSSSNLPLTHAVPTAVSYGAACERIDTAANREQIAEVFVEYAKGRCDALVVLLVRDGNAVGWRGYVAPPGKPRTPVEELSLPIGGASSLQEAHDGNTVFVGAPPSPFKPVEAALWTALGADPPPAEVVVVPITIKQRAVNLVYAHTLGGSPAASLVNELSELANRAQASYARLIRQTRGS
jgi:hypothetical protein